MKNVAILTTFFDVDSGYSLIAVADNQIKMLLNNGYNPRVLVQENFTYSKYTNSVWRPEIIDIRPIIPFIHLDNNISEDFEDRVALIEKALEENLKDIDVCITHDIILQQWYKEHNVAVRRYAKKHPNLLWLHWLHSCPTPNNINSYPDNCRYTSPPGYIIYPNSTELSLVRQTYKLNGVEWKVKPLRHTVDFLESFTYDKLTKDIAKKSGLLEAEFAVVYPARLDRGKQPEKIIRLLAGIQKSGHSVALLIVDWQSSGQRFQDYIDELLVLSKELNLEGRVNFTSRLDDRANQGLPRNIVLELLDISNVYIHPSRVETYSLVTHEAMARNNLVVLNHDFPVMRELFGEAAIYMDFGSDRNERTYYPDEQTFWNDEAKRLITEFKQNRNLVARNKVKLEWCPQQIWKEFEPLLYLQAVGE